MYSSDVEIIPAICKYLLSILTGQVCVPVSAIQTREPWLYLSVLLLAINKVARSEWNVICDLLMFTISESLRNPAKPNQHIVNNLISDRQLFDDWPYLSVNNRRCSGNKGSFFWTGLLVSRIGPLQDLTNVDRHGLSYSAMLCAQEMAHTASFWIRIVCLT